MPDSFNGVTSYEFDNLNFVFKSDNRVNSFDRYDEKRNDEDNYVGGDGVKNINISDKNNIGRDMGDQDIKIERVEGKLDSDSCGNENVKSQNSHLLSKIS